MKKAKMKTSWSVDYVFGKYGGQRSYEWLNAKAAELQEKTGVKWVWYTAHCKYVFQPTWEIGETEPAENAELEKGLLEIAPDFRNAKSFTKAAELTGESLVKIIPVLLSLAKRGLIVPMVGRTGYAAAYHKRRIAQ